MLIGKNLATSIYGDAAPPEWQGRMRWFFTVSMALLHHVSFLVSFWVDARSWLGGKRVIMRKPTSTSALNALLQAKVWWNTPGFLNIHDGSNSDFWWSDSIFPHSCCRADGLTFFGPYLDQCPIADLRSPLALYLLCVPNEAKPEGYVSPHPRN